MAEKQLNQDFEPHVSISGTSTLSSSVGSEGVSDHIPQATSICTSLELKLSLLLVHWMCRFQCIRAFKRGYPKHSLPCGAMGFCKDKGTNEG